MPRPTHASMDSGLVRGDNAGLIGRPERVLEASPATPGRATRGAPSTARFRAPDRPLPTTPALR